MKRCIFFMCLLIQIFFLGNLFAEVPDDISYSGRITENGVLISADRNVKFRFYNSEEGGAQLGSEIIQNLSITDGIINTTLAPAIDWRNGDIWLEVEVGSKILSPRQKITSQVFALHSMTAEDISKPAGENIDLTIGDKVHATIYSSGTVAINDDLSVSGGFNLLPPGVVFPFVSSIIPSGWLLCDGSAVSRTTYADLFAVIGITYGTGDGVSTFNLPDMRDKFIIGRSATKSLGTSGGSSTITISNMPSHTHIQNAHGHTITDPGHSHSFDWEGQSGSIKCITNGVHSYSASSVATATTGIIVNNATATNQNTGGGTDYWQPYVALNYIIKY